MTPTTPFQTLPDDKSTTYSEDTTTARRRLIPLRKQIVRGKVIRGHGTFLRTRMAELPLVVAKLQGMRSSATPLRK